MSINLPRYVIAVTEAVRQSTVAWRPKNRWFWVVPARLRYADVGRTYLSTHGIVRDEPAGTLRAAIAADE